MSYTDAEGFVLQPKVAVLKHAIISLGEWAEFIIKSHELQPEMHLLQVAQLEFIASLQCIYPSADEVRGCWVFARP